MLEPAIPPHLLLPRTQPPRLPAPDFAPPNAAYTARFPRSVSHLVMATVCAQARDPAATLSATDVLAPVLACLKRGGVAGDSGGGSDGGSGSGSGSGSGISGGDNGDGDGDVAAPPAAFDLITFRDVAGVHNVGVVAYWAGGRARWEEWAEQSGFEAWWAGIEPRAEEVGWFREVFFPSVDRYETIFSDGEVGDEGAARLREGLSGAIREHIYWGSMRDRMPVAQVDGLVGEAPVAEDGEAGRGTEGRRVVVRGRRNLCVIRSGQDWSAMVPRERELYLETMHPVLVKGMDFLRDEGRSVGCHSCRFVEELDPGDVARGTERTFGFAFFRDMEALEKWSKSHRTHLDIFGRFLQYVKELDGNISLRLFHEVLALTPEQQLLEYVGCHPRTGLVGL